MEGDPSQPPVATAMIRCHLHRDRTDSEIALLMTQFKQIPSPSLVVALFPL
ncbi:hypothetical protein AXF42_Ash006616 [Apostasia shenzhenica]|uniref:Uncharacterized protein n=1 Tax=Apostasia shenzhenica TaxID=1088818 RepID=A0A2I0AIM4_9ASPA|nr:hypothetical protein AXF42_Ash006616 [Apostasia shenzhenica]